MLPPRFIAHRTRRFRLQINKYQKEEATLTDDLLFYGAADVTRLTTGNKTKQKHIPVSKEAYDHFRTAKSTQASSLRRFLPAEHRRPE